MSRFTDNLTARMKALGMNARDVTAAMNRSGVDVAYSTVAGWLNGSRGGRWDVEELRTLLDVLQTDLSAMAGHAELIEDAVPAMTAREMSQLTEEQQQIILATVRAMRGS